MATQDNFYGDLHRLINGQEDRNQFKTMTYKIFPEKVAKPYISVNILLENFRKTKNLYGMIENCQSFPWFTSKYANGSFDFMETYPVDKF